jgi:hypothetical protein
MRATRPLERKVTQALADRNEVNEGPLVEVSPGALVLTGIKGWAEQGAPRIASGSCGATIRIHDHLLDLVACLRNARAPRRFYRGRPSQEDVMRRVIVSSLVLVFTGIPASYARGMHSSGTGALMAPANPSVPPSLTPDARLTGSAPLPPHHQPRRSDVGSLQLKLDPEDARVDRMIGGICRGC